MGKLKNIGSAISRYQASKGFGVHSPFAFSFITNVLDERYGYYCYERLKQLRLQVTERSRKEQGYKPRVITISEAADMFRVANHYNPPLFLSIGGSYGVAAASLLSVSSQSRMVLYDPMANDNAAAKEILSSYGDRITRADSLQEAIGTYSERLGDNGLHFIAINNITDNDASTIAALMADAATWQGVVIIRNIDTSGITAKLWQQLKYCMTYGMTFTNGKMAVVILNPKLPRQDFEIWLS